MLGFLIYTLEAAIIFALLTATYRYVYCGTSYHQWERGYLLAAPLASYILPLLKVDFEEAPRITRPYDRVVDIVSRDAVDVVTLSHEKTVAGGLYSFFHSQLFDTIVTILFAVYIAGVAVKLISFVNGIRKTLSLRRGAYHIVDGNVRIYTTPVNTVAFSFFRNIFVGTRAQSLSSQELQIIQHHELRHIRGWHSVDTLLYGLFAVLQWINPATRIAAKSSRNICELIADRQTAGSNGVTEYSRLILRLGIQKASDAISFSTKSSGSLVKRIAQLLNAEGEKYRRIRFAATLPIIALPIAAYLLLGGMVNPKSSGLDIPIDGKYRVTAGFFENQRYMNCEGEQYRVSHRQMDFAVDKGVAVLAPMDARVTIAEPSVICLSNGGLDIILGGIADSGMATGDEVGKGDKIGFAIGDEPLYIKVLVNGRPENPELVFKF